MAAGDLIDADYQIELRGRLHGPTTRFDTSPDGWAGLGLPPFKTQDVDLDQADGVFAGRDFLGARLLTFPLEWGGHGPAEVMLDLLVLNETWAPSSVDLELHLRLPGWGHFFVIGRPRGLAEELGRMPKGEGAALATFQASDPAITFVSVDGS